MEDAPNRFTQIVPFDQILEITPMSRRFDEPQQAFAAQRFSQNTQQTHADTVTAALYQFVVLDPSGKTLCETDLTAFAQSARMHSGGRILDRWRWRTDLAMRVHANREN